MTSATFIPGGNGDTFQKVYAQLIDAQDQLASSSNPTSVQIMDGVANGPLRMDTSTRALNVIDYSHHEVHSGSHFNVRRFVTVQKAGTKDYLLVTPNTAKWAHLIIGVEGISSTIEVELFEGTVTSNNGTACTVFNRNRNSLGTATTLCFEDPIVTTAGTSIADAAFGAGRNSSGGGTRDTEEIMLRQNTKYLLRTTEQNIQITIVNTVFDWYEHTDRD